jgi:hypothetical protein
MQSFLRRNVTTPVKPRKTPDSRKLGETGRQTNEPDRGRQGRRQDLALESRDSPSESRFFFGGIARVLKLGWVDERSAG